MTETSWQQAPRLSSAADLLLDDYLRRLGQAARRLPSWQRQLFLAETAAQIDAELGTSTEMDLDQMQALLSSLGDPDTLARANAAAVPDWPGNQELAAVLTLLLGGVVLPVIGWLAGIVLLWASPRWRPADKLLGTLVWPGGLAGVGAAFWVGLADVPSAPDAGLAVIFLVVLAVVAAVPPVLVAVRLLHTARRPVRTRYLGTASARLPAGPAAS